MVLQLRWCVAGCLFAAAFKGMAAGVPPVCPPDAGLAELRQAFGGERLRAVTEFRYRLTMTDLAKAETSHADYRLDPVNRRLRIERPGDVRWWDGSTAWQRLGPNWLQLDAAAARRLQNAIAYNFVPVLLDPATTASPAGPHRLRLTPRGAEPFTVALDPATCRITANHFGDGAVADETDYQVIDGLSWPMRFEVKVGGKTVTRGEFSQLAFSIAGASGAADQPQIPVAAARGLPTVPPAAAALVGPGWISSERNDYNLNFTAAGDRLVFARSDARFAGSRIYTAVRNGDSWSAPEQLPFSDPRYRDSDPWLTPDGRWLYFVSDRPPNGDGPPKKDLDIWRVALSSGWGKPEHLAAANSDGVELGPEVHDGWLYFNSTRSGGPARLSIWRLRLQDGAGEAGATAVPEPLPAALNGAAQQGDFTIAPDGRTAVFWQQVNGSDGDLFAARRTGGGWSRPVRLPAPFSGPGFDFTPQFSPDGAALYYASERKFHGAEVPLLNGLANLYAAPRQLIEAALDAALGSPSAGAAK